MLLVLILRIAIFVYHKSPTDCHNPKGCEICLYIGHIGSLRSSGQPRYCTQETLGIINPMIHWPQRMQIEYE